MTRSLTRVSGSENRVPDENVKVPVDRSKTQGMELWSPLTPVKWQM